MRPKQPDPKEPDDLFRARLSQQIDRRHPLVRLAGVVDWEGSRRDSASSITRTWVGRACRSG
jgi:transposase, IS5 family